MSMLRLDNVWKQYGDQVVLKGVDLSVETHQVVCLIGASGSGKSTLLRCIDLLEQVDDGRIWLGDEDITEPGVDADQARRRIGMVFQSYNLFPHLTVLDNVTLAPRRVHKKPRRDAEAAALHLLGRFGLADKAQDHPDKLSGGQQQRVAVVCAMATDPQVMLFDEVTSALDPELVGEVLDVIRGLKEGGMTMVIATHEMAFARDVADTVCFLDDGVLLEQGPPAQILSAPTQRRTREFLTRVLPT
ncbi:MAG: amino acid ABC transporter ATP-binding protein [Nocardioidaceae bacterium]